MDGPTKRGVESRSTRLTFPDLTTSDFTEKPNLQAIECHRKITPNLIHENKI